MTQEIWKTIPGYTEYQISNLGNVISLKNSKKRMLKPAPMQNGYLVVSLSNAGKTKTFTIHSLVAEAFLGYKRDGFKTNTVDHIDQIKTNNILTNLQLISQRENTSKSKRSSGIKTSKYTGVSWNKGVNKWIVYIRIGNKHKCLGTFVNEEDAHKAYQKELTKVIP
jgi:hypothetical protein